MADYTTNSPSGNVDEHVVKMTFDNKQFEKNARQSLDTVEKLKSSMNFEASVKGLDKLEDGVTKTNKSLGSLNDAADALNQKFSAWGVSAQRTIQRITDDVENLAKRMIKSITITPIQSGFNEYELKMNSMKTIMASTGASVKEVNQYLNELNKYSDETIYSFSDMTNNIGKFTNAGVNLKTAVNAIKGVSSEAALAGANANEASRAMYNFSQALSAGYVKLIDWKSIENANMATKDFKQNLIDTAVALGKVKKQGDMYVSTTKNMNGKTSAAFNATKNFNDSLAHQWMTTDVLTTTLEAYSHDLVKSKAELASMTSEQRKAYEQEKKQYEQDMKRKGFTDKQIKQYEQLGHKAMQAAKEINTFSKMVDTLQEAVQSSWAATSEYIFGTLDQAKKLWTNLEQQIEKVIMAHNDLRNSILSDWNELGGRDELIKSFKNIGSAIGNIFKPIKQAFLAVFDPFKEQGGLGKSLYNATLRFREFTASLKLTKEEAKDVQNIFGAFFLVLKRIGQVVGTAIKYLGKLINLLRPIGDVILKVGSTLADLLRYVDYFIRVAGTFIKVVLKDLFGIDDIFGAIQKGVQKFSDFIIKALSNFSNALADTFTTSNKNTAKELTLGQKTAKVVIKILDVIVQGFAWVADAAVNTVRIVVTAVGAIGIAIGGAFAPLFSTIRKVNLINRFLKKLDSMFTVTAVAAENGGKRVQKSSKSATDGVNESVEKLSLADKVKIGIANILNFISTGFKNVIGFFSNFINNVKQFGFKQAILNALHSIYLGVQNLFKSIGDWIRSIHIPAPIKNFFNGVLDFIKGIRDAFGKFFDWLGDRAPIIKTIQDAIDKFKESVKDGILPESITGKAEGSTKKTSSLLTTLKKVADGVGKAFHNMADGIRDFLSTIDMAKVKTAIILTLMGLITLSIARMIWGIGTLTSNIGVKLIPALSGLASSMKTTLDMFRQAKFGQTTIFQLKIRELAQAVGILTAAVVILSAIPTKKLGPAIGAVTVLMVALAGLNAVMMKLAKSFNDENVKGYKAAIGGIVAFSTAILMIAGSIKMMDSINDIQGLLPKVASIGVLFAEFSALMILVSKTWGKKKMTLGGLASILVFASALQKIAKAVVWMADVDFNVLIEGAKKTAILIAILGGISLAMSLNHWYTGFNMMGFAVALMMLVVPLKQLAKIDYTNITKALNELYDVILTMGILVGAIVIFGAASKKGRSSVNATKSFFLGLGTALLEIVAVVAIMGNMKKSTLKRGIESVTFLMGFMTLSLSLVALAMRGKSVQGSFKTLMGIVTAVGLLTGSVLVLGSVDLATLAKGTGAVSMLLVFFGVCARLSSGLKDVKAAPIVAMMITIMQIVGMTLVLSSLPIPQLVAGVAGISVLMLALGKMFEMINHMSITKTDAVKMMITSLATVGVLVGSVIALTVVASQYGVGNMVAALIGISGLILTLGIVFNVINNTTKGITKGFKSIPLILSAGLLLGELVGSIAVLSIVCASVGMENMITAVASISGLIVTLGVVFTVVNTTSKGITKGFSSLPLILSAGLLLAEIVGALYVLAYATNKYGAKNVITGVASISGMLLALSGVCVLASKVGPQLIQGTLVLSGAIDIALANMMGIAEGLGWIMNQGDKASNGGATKNLKAFVNLLSFLGKAIGEFFGNVAKYIGNGAGEGIEKVANSLSKFFKILGDVKPSSIKNVAKLLKEIAAVGRQNFWGGFNFATDYDDPASDSLAQFMTKIANAVAKFKEVLTDNEVTDEDITAFNQTVTAFNTIVKVVKKIPKTGFDSSEYGDNHINQFTDWLAGTKGKPGFAVIMTRAVGAFSSGIVKGSDGKIDTSVYDEGIKRFKNSISLFRQIVNVVKKIPNTGGAAGWWAGNNDLDDFLKMISGSKGKPGFAETMTKAIAQFSKDVTVDKEGNVDDTIFNAGVDRFKNCISALAQIAEAADSIPNSGGALGKLAGNNDLDNFLQQIGGKKGKKSFGQVMTESINYFVKMTGADGKAISDDDFNKAISMFNSGIQMLAQLATINVTIPKTGGKLADIFGDKDMGKFLDEIPKAGQKLAEATSSFVDVEPENVSKMTTAMNSLATLMKAVTNTSYDIPASGNNGYTQVTQTVTSLAKVAKDLKKAAPGIVKFSTDMGDFDADSVATMRDSIYDLYVKLDNVAGKNKDIKKFGSALLSVSSGATSLVSTANSWRSTAQFKTANDLTTDITADASSTSANITAMGKTLVQFSKDLESVDTNAMEHTANVTKNFTDMVKNVQSNLEKAVKVIEDNTETFRKKGKNLIATLISGMGSKSNDFKKELGRIVSIGTNYLDNQSKTEFKKSGTNLLEGLIVGLKDETTTNKLTKTVKDIADKANTDFNTEEKIGSPSKVWKQAGVYCLQGLRNGLKDRGAMSDVKESSKSAGKALNEAFRQKMQIHSPSKVAMKDGMQIINGLVSGIKNGASALKGGAKKMASILRGSFLGEFKFGDIEKTIMSKYKGKKGQIVKDLEKLIPQLKLADFSKINSDTYKALDKLGSTALKGAGTGGISDVSLDTGSGSGSKKKGSSGSGKGSSAKNSLGKALASSTGLSENDIKKILNSYRKLFYKITPKYSPFREKYLNKTKKSWGVTADYIAHSFKSKEMRQIAVYFAKNLTSSIDKKVAEYAKKNGLKVGSKAYKNAIVKFTKEAMTYAEDAVNHIYERINKIGGKTLLNTFKMDPELVAEYVKKFKKASDKLPGVSKALQKEYGANAKGASAGLQVVGDYLWENSDEGKENKAALRSALNTRKSLQTKMQAEKTKIDKSNQKTSDKQIKADKQSLNNAKHGMDMTKKGGKYQGKNYKQWKEAYDKRRKQYNEDRKWNLKEVKADRDSAKRAMDRAKKDGKYQGKSYKQWKTIYEKKRKAYNQLANQRATSAKKLSELETQYEDNEKTVKELIDKEANGANEKLSELLNNFKDTFKSAQEITAQSADAGLNLFSKFSYGYSEKDWKAVRDTTTGNIVRSGKQAQILAGYASTQIEAFNNYLNDMEQLNKDVKAGKFSNDILEYFQNAGFSGAADLHAILQSDAFTATRFNTYFTAQKKANGKTLISNFQNSRAKVKKWVTLLKKLASKGLSGDVLYNLAKDGYSEDSLATLEAMDSLDPEEFKSLSKELNDQESDIKKESESAMAAVVAGFSNGAKGLSDEKKKILADALDLDDADWTTIDSKAKALVDGTFQAIMKWVKAEDWDKIFELIYNEHSGGLLRDGDLEGLATLGEKNGAITTDDIKKQVLGNVDSGLSKILGPEYFGLLRDIYPDISKLYDKYANDPVTFITKLSSLSQNEILTILQDLENRGAKDTDIYNDIANLLEKLTPKNIANAMDATPNEKYDNYNNGYSQRFITTTNSKVFSNITGTDLGLNDLYKKGNFSKAQKTIMNTAIDKFNKELPTLIDQSDGDYSKLMSLVWKYLVGAVNDVYNSKEFKNSPEARKALNDWRMGLGLAGGYSSKFKSDDDGIYANGKKGLTDQDLKNWRQANRVFDNPDNYVIIGGIAYRRPKLTTVNADSGSESVESLNAEPPTVQLNKDQSDAIIDTKKASAQTVTLLTDTSGNLVKTIGNQEAQRSELRLYNNQQTYDDHRLIDELQGARDDIRGISKSVKGMKVTLDSGQLVGAITPQIDRSLGQRANQRGGWY